MGFFLLNLMDNTNPLAGADTTKVSADSRVVQPAFGLGRYAPFNWERIPETTLIRLFWGRIVLWLLVLACIGWTVLATGLFIFVKYRRGFDGVQFSHMLFLPWKIDDYRRAKGEFLVKTGLTLAERHEWREAFELLRPGLEAVPENREARLMVARIYLMAGRADLTRTTLIEGLRLHGDELDYLREVLGYFFGLQADDTVIALTSGLRGRLVSGTPVSCMANTGLAYAYFNRARYGDAEETLAASRLLGTPEGRYVMARIAWARGRHEESVGRLRELTAEVPQDFDIYRALITYLTGENRWDEVRRAGLMRQLAVPEKPEGYIDFIEACGKKGDEKGRMAAETAFLERFGGDSGALLKLSELASREGRVKTAAQVAACCRALGRGEDEADLLWSGAMLEREDYLGVISLWADLSPEISKWSERNRLILEGMRAVALYARGDGNEAAALVLHLNETNLLPAQTLTTLAMQLQRVGQKAEARQMLRHAVELDPLNQPALVLLLRGLRADYDMLGAFPLIRRLSGVRNPPEDLLQSLVTDLDSDLYIILPGLRGERSAFKEFMSRRELAK